MHHHTLAICKPDCMRKQQQGQVIDRILRAGFRIIGLKMLRMSKAQAEAFYAEHRGKDFYEDLTIFMSSGPCLPMVLEKENAVSEFRKLIGATDPAKAEPGTIRRDFAESIRYNVIHGSDTNEHAVTEIAFFFSQAELLANE